MHLEALGSAFICPDGDASDVSAGDRRQELALDEYSFRASVAVPTATPRSIQFVVVTELACTESRRPCPQASEPTTAPPLAPGQVLPALPRNPALGAW
jgi:hypothetical protein